MPLKMRPSSRSTFSSFKLKTLGAAVISALLLSNAYAAGLGKLTVLSSLGQPLRAEIELVAVAPDEAGSLVPKLASADAFRQANIDMNPALFSLRFAVEQRNSRQIIRITSTQSMNEPFIDMLLELGGSKGRLVREYTFLLDPPEMRRAQSAQFDAGTSARTLPPVVPQPARQAESAPVAVQEAPSRAERSGRVASTPKPDTQVSDEYKVKKGDTLAKIANQHRSGGVSLDQMLVALYRANPDAFIDKNMNRLRAGRILAVPDAEAVKAIGQSDAKGVVVAQAVDFNRYRNKLAEQVSTAAPKKSEEGKQIAGGKITTRIQEESAATDSRDKLKLSKSGTTLAAGSDKVVAGASAEDLVAKDKALAEANARVSELEKNVSELQKILEIKNKDLAGQQKQAEAVKAAESAPVATPPALTSTTAPTPPVAANDSAATPAVADKAESAPVASVVPPPVAAKQKPPVAVAPPPPQPSFFEDLTNNALFLPGAAVLLALLAALGIFSARRRKQPKPFEDSILSDSSLKTNSLFGSTGGQSVDTNNSVFNSNFVPSASQLDTNEVDPIAEADVYIAYGRDAQAEEILKEALRNQPDRHAVRVKLLEIYANRNDVRSFEILASELYSMTKGEGNDWQQAAGLGLILDPANPLYASGTAPEGSTSRAAALSPETRPLDANLDDLLATTQSKTALNMSDSIETSPYFGSTTLLTEDALNARQTAVQEAEAKKAAADDLDFDLEGLDIGDAGEKAVELATAPADMPADIAAIDFDFLDDKVGAPAVKTPEVNAFSDTVAPPVVPAPAAAPEVLLPEFASENAVSEDVPHTANLAESAAKLPEFDLSDIALDFAPSADAAAEEQLPSLESIADEESYSGSAEMATKLDLAIAYQEIGDKEGARELLEEVLKGGNTEQAEKARNLLGKLA